jgi:glutamate 5-kinase
VEGQFERGDAVVIVAEDGRAVAHGLTAYSSTDAITIMGAKSQQIEQKLGYQGRDELIHRDNLVLLE